MVTICQKVRSFLIRDKNSSRKYPELKEKYKAYDTSSSNSSVNNEKNGLLYYPNDVSTGREIIEQPCQTKTVQVPQRYYGVTFRTTFNEKIHDEEDKYWDPLEEEWQAANQVQWMVKKNIPLEIGVPVRFAVYRTWEKDCSRKGRIRVLSFSGDRNPPSSLGASCSSATATKVDTLLDSTIDFRDILESPVLIRCENSRGKKYDRLNHMIQMTLTEEGKINIEYLHENKMCWNVELEQ